jgi:hypothetical protein
VLGQSVSSLSNRVILVVAIVAVPGAASMVVFTRFAALVRGRQTLECLVCEAARRARDWEHF